MSNNVWYHGKTTNLNTNEFTEYDSKYIRCCCHVRKTAMALSVVLIIICIICISVLSMAFAFPESHTYLKNDHINLEYKNQPEKFELAYSITVAVVDIGFIVHLFALIVALIGVIKIRPCLLWPELIVISLFAGLLLFGTVSSIIFMIIMLGFLWLLTTINAVAVAFTAFYMYTMIYCYHYIKDKRKARNATDGNGGYSGVYRKQYSYYK